MENTNWVDVSHHNGTIDFSALIATGKVDAVIIRVCHGETLDRKFSVNLAGCKALDIPYAFYWYAESATKEGAENEAKFVLSKIKGTSPLFVAYDAECSSLAALSKNDTTDVAWAALEIVKKAGYRPYVYCNESWRKNEIDIDSLKSKGVGFWYARYIDEKPEEVSCDMWQYSKEGTINGNGSTYIDLNVCYNATLNAKIKGIIGDTAAKGNHPSSQFSSSYWSCAVSIYLYKDGKIEMGGDFKIHMTSKAFYKRLHINLKLTEINIEDLKYSKNKRLIINYIYRWDGLNVYDRPTHGEGKGKRSIDFNPQDLNNKDISSLYLSAKETNYMYPIGDYMKPSF